MTHSDFTEADVTAGGKAIHSAWVRLDEGMDLFGKPAHEHLARAVLAAVAPAMRDRWRAEALRDASLALRVLYKHSDTAAYLIDGWACYYEHGGEEPPDFVRARADALRSGGTSDE